LIICNSIPTVYVKIVKIGQVDPEIIWLMLKNKKLTQAIYIYIYIYSPSSKFAERAKTLKI